MLLSGDSMYDLLTKYMVSGTDFYQGSMLLPNNLLRLVKLDYLPNGVKMAITMSAGVLICAVLSWRVKNNKNWIVDIYKKVILTISNALT